MHKLNLEDFGVPYVEEYFFINLKTSKFGLATKWKIIILNV